MKQHSSWIHTAYTFINDASAVLGRCDAMPAAAAVRKDDCSNCALPPAVLRIIPMLETYQSVSSIDISHRKTELRRKRVRAKCLFPNEPSVDPWYFVLGLFDFMPGVHQQWVFPKSSGNTTLQRWRKCRIAVDVNFILSSDDWVEWITSRHVDRVSLSCRRHVIGCILTSVWRRRYIGHTS